ncbi:hypothetical protein D4R89_10230 [bacterium]|nr:MAG: hypothetical protein D4R89_10230 [bacterium]
MRVRSNRALHGVLPSKYDVRAAADVQLTFAGTSAIPAEWEALPWRLARELLGDGWALRSWMASSARGVAHRLETCLGRDKTTILFNADGSRVRIHWNHSAPYTGAFWEDMSAWVIEAALGFAARLRGWPVLHGSVVVTDGRAIGLLGHKGVGKSTLAAAFLADGCPILADDHVALKQEGAGFIAQPGPPRLRLWPASLPVLATQADDLPRAYSFLEKRLVKLTPDAGNPLKRHQDAPLPLRALYILEPRDPVRIETEIEPLPPAAALHQALVFRWSRVPITSEHAAAELGALARLTQTIPIRRVRRPDGLDTLGQVVRAIREDAISHVD